MTAAKPRKSGAIDHVYAEFVRRAREVLGHAWSSERRLGDAGDAGQI